MRDSICKPDDLDINSLSDIWFTNTFSHSISCLFILLGVYWYPTFHGLFPLFFNFVFLFLLTGWFQMTYHLVCRLFLLLDQVCYRCCLSYFLFHSLYPSTPEFLFVSSSWFYLFTELSILSLYCFLDFVELSMLSYSSLSFLKTILLNYLSSNT